MTNILFSVVILFISSANNLISLASEPSREVCFRSRDCGYCGYCVYTKNMEGLKERRSRCLYPYEGVIHKNKRCSPEQLCESNTCKHKGYCTQNFGFYVPSCFCLETNFHGNNCGKKNKPRSSNKDYATGIVVYFKKTIDATHLYAVDIYVTTQNSGNDLQFKVETSEGFVGRFSKKLGKCEDNKVRLNPYKEESDCRPEERCFIYLKDCEDVFTAKLFFPYISINSSRVFGIDQSKAAYEAWIKITVTNLIVQSRISVFQHRYPLLIGPSSYDFYHLRIEFKYCSRHYDERSVYFRQTPIQFTIDVEPCFSDMKVAWIVWDSVCTDEIVPVVFSYNDKLLWTLPPFTLPAGKYKVHAKVSRIYNHKMFSNFAECYFEVKLQPIVAVIDGGNVRTVSLDDGLVVSAENSFDPNQRRSEQYHLQFSWKCETPAGLQCYTFVSSNSRSCIVPSSYLVANSSYTYTVTVMAHGLKPATASQTVHVLQFCVTIQCLSNCFTDAIPSEVVLLEASLTKDIPITSECEWMYKIKEESADWLSMNPLQDKSYPPDTLCIKPHSLEQGKTYIIRVKTTYRGKVLTSFIEINIASQPRNGSCSVLPLSGVFSETEFEIICSGFESNNAILIYEFFDTHKSEDIFDARLFKGRMLDSNFEGKLDKVKLTRGVVAVVVNTMQGPLVMFKYEIELASKNISSSDVDESLIKMHRSLAVGLVHGVLRKVSEVPDLLVVPSAQIRPLNLFELLVNVEGKVPIKGEGGMKMGLSAIRNVIDTLIRKLDHIPNIAELRDTMKEKKRLSEQFKIKASQQFGNPYLTRFVLIQLACTFFYLIEILFEQKNNFVTLNETSEMDVKYQTLQDTSIFTEEVFNDIIYAISLRQDIHLKPYTGATVSGLTTINSQTDIPSKLALTINSENIFSSKMAPSLVNTLQAYTTLTVHSLTTKINPFLADDFSISTKLTSLSLFARTHTNADMVRLTKLKQPIDIFLETTQVNFGEIKILVEQLDPSISSNVLDLKVKIVRIDLPEKCRLFIEFLLPNDTTQLRVSIDEGLRPSYKRVAESTTLINYSFSTFDAPLRMSDRRRFVYMGILPAFDATVGGTVEVTVRFHCNLCLSRIGYQWDPKSCTVGLLTNKSVLHCRCTHLSFFAGSIIIPPNKIDPFNDISLFLTVKSNPLSLLYLLCLFIVFLLMYIWALNKDKRDSKRRRIVVLEDNFPCDAYLYVVAVFTGSRFFSGTTANVGIIIEGSYSRSRAHILSVPDHHPFRKNTDFWFLIRTSDRLGILKHIVLWHDNSGISPGWYCDKILVYDLKVSTVYTFFVEDWLAIGNDEYTEAVVFPATERDFQHFGRITLDNIVRELQHFHIFGRMFSGNIHSRMTRLDRAMIFNSSFMSANLVNIAYFKADPGSTVGVDEPKFFLGTKYLYLSVQVLAITLIISFALDALFRKSYDLKSSNNRAESSLRLVKVYLRPSYIKPKPKKSKSAWFRPFEHSIINKELTFYRYFVRMLLKKSKPMAFLPVTLSATSPLNKRRNTIYILAISISILLVFVSFYFIFLYGLKLGHEKSKLWVSTLLVVIAQQYLLLFPIKMFIVAIILASQFLYLTPISSYNVVVDDTSIHEPDTSFYSSLIVRRSNPIYYPLSDAKIDVFKKKNEQKELHFKILEVVIVIIFIVIAMELCNIYWSPKAVHSNLHVKRMISKSESQIMVNYQDVFNRSELESCLQYLFGDSDKVYNPKWYNDIYLNPYQPDTVLGPVPFAQDCVLTLMSTPTLRQIRVIQTACRVPSQFNSSSWECIPAWSPDVEDTNDYDYMWTTPIWKSDKQETTMWDYSDRSWTFRSSMSPTGIEYPSGGYVARLSLDKDTARLNILQLISDHWIDQLTRILFVEFTLFNVNSNSFIHVTLIAEQLSLGVVLTSASTETVKLDVFELLWTAGFSLFLLLLFVKNVLDINRHGLFKYLRRLENLYQILIFCLGTLSIVFFIVHDLMSAWYMNELNFHSVEDTFLFRKTIEYHKMSSVCATVVFCCLVIRLLSLTWIFGQEFTVVYKTLKTSSFHFTVIFIVVLLSTLLFEKGINYLLNNFSISSISLLPLFVSIDNIKHIQLNVMQISFFIWKRFLFLMVIVLVTRNYKQAYNKQF